MNLFLADIRGLTPDLQAPGESDSEALHQLSDGAGGSLDSSSAGSRQVVEFNMFFDQLRPRQPAPDAVVPGHPGDARGDYPAYPPVRVTTDGEPALLRPAAVSTTRHVMAPATVSGLAATSGWAGASLPPGGNSLPGPVPVAPPGIVAAGAVTVVEPPPVRTGAVASAIRTPLDAAIPRPPAPAGLEPAPRGDAHSDKARAAAQPAKAIDSPPTAQLALAGARLNVASPGFPADTRPVMPAPAAGMHAPLPAAAEKSSAKVATTGASTFKFVAANAPAQRQPVAAEARSAPVSPVPGQDSRAAASAEALAAPPRGHAAAAESAPAMSPRPAPAAAPLPANGALEIPLADAVSPALRGPEAASPGLPAGGFAGAAPAMQVSASPASNGAGLPPQLESLAIPRQAGAGDWGNGLGERVSWMIDQRQNSATIRLDPPTLGKLDVQVRVADDATTITIQAHHAPTRELIEASATRLRDFLQDSGFNNVNVDVSQRQDQQHARAQAAPDARDGADGAVPEPDHPGSTIAGREAAGDGASLVDTFA